MMELRMKRMKKGKKTMTQLVSHKLYTTCQDAPLK